MLRLTTKVMTRTFKSGELLKFQKGIQTLMDMGFLLQIC